MEINEMVTTSGNLMAVPQGPMIVPVRGAGEGITFSLVVPTLNESQNLEELIAQLEPAIASAVGQSYEILVVDDDSADRTWEVAAAIAARNPRVRAMRRIGERGLATAVVRGWQVARGEWLGVIDADLQHPPEAIARLLQAALAGADLAVASRDAEGGGTSDWPALRGFISRSSRALGRAVLPRELSRVSDPMTGFFIVRRESVQGVRLNPCGYKILVEILVRAHIERIAEVGYVFRSRQRGESKASLKIFAEYVQHLVRLRREVRKAQAEARPKSEAAPLSRP
ncbi:MAG: polyprenol monophosphomannose synthase [Acidobacteriota bacterium]|nr:polyprenol monophosphomannose synthase [Acidobacteriota bacterium]